MSFAEIEGVIGHKLPASAYRHRPWWSNNASNSVMTQVWLDAGYRTERVDMSAKKLIFKRVNRDYGIPPAGTQQSGVAEPQSAFKHEAGAPSKLARSPLWGALKGLLWIEPGYDLAQSPFTEEELDEMDKRMEEKAALIEAGMRKRK